MSSIFDNRYILKVKEAIAKVLNQVEGPKNSDERISSTTEDGQFRSSDLMPACLSFLSLPELLKWSEDLTKSAATVFDRAMDRNYLKDRIGGGNHRMFDDGHDLVGAWDAVRNAKSDDKIHLEIVEYASALWKDLATVKGLPFATWSQDSYGKCADWLAAYVPGASKEWFYDLMSFDAFELASTSIGTVGVIFCFSQSDKERLSEMLGTMGIVSITSANPLMGIALVFCVAYSYFIKKERLAPKQVASGAGLAAISTGIFTVLTFPVLVELGIVIIVTKLVRDRLVNNDELLRFIRTKAQQISLPASFAIPSLAIIAKSKTL
ncbi:MAG: hypothetical protein H8K08_03125 [Nitrospira sp.]|jgi:hypothetical protein|nr:hypothetical protein [Nitrospira sp.]